jgi:hypothetical protein
MTLPREIVHSLLLLALFAAVVAVVPVLGLLLVRVLG